MRSFPCFGCFWHARKAVSRASHR